ncbi:hypothetical protein B4U79_09983 [Dinothrombium tinctorium]|uniref:Uncharacterized protein n=1 Tax=Dinothrombium tinctorium TaxID=1965070 RepID=A0A3S3NXT7_9ACAR|nr:hypothetical protein B4U79_16060 [Dinothrombium tinctorium]RWS11274.1 hypothetical protein B4U79_09983 [Dinothrombium tinctorium]
MNSAAVIGRQLRQQQTTGRTSGPLVPPQQPSKGRPRTPSHLPQRPYSPAPASMTGGTGTGEQRLNVISSAQTGYHQYPSPHSGLHGEKDKKKQEEEPRIRCTWHCFCIALKALSGGIVLLVAGTVMSVVGFVAEANIHQQQVNGKNGTVEVGEHIRNLTFAGPVIMGLGGIVIVAALVLTFEVRDTLGVKVAPVKPDKNPPGLEGSSNVVSISSTKTTDTRKNTVASISSNTKPGAGGSSGGEGQVKDAEGAAGTVQGTGKNKATQGSLTLPLAVLSDLSHSSLGSTGLKKDHLQDTIHETVFNETASGNGVPATFSGTLSSVGSGRSGGDQQVSISRRRYAAADQCIASPSSGTTFSHLLSPNIETLYFGLPSPQDTELSDPEGCSLTVPTRWRSSRCSCSGSPTHSMSMELYLEDNDPPVSIKIIEQHRMQQQLILHQQMLLQQQHQQLQLQQKLLQQQQLKQPRRPKVIASIESDGLSSTSSSSDDLFHSGHRCDKVNAPSRNYAVHNCYDQNELTAPLLAHTAPTAVVDKCSDCGHTPSSSSGLASSTSPRCKPSSVNPSPHSSDTAASVNCTAAADKRFPLLRQGALGNGSVPPNKS